jgi:hypothetical protein
VVKQVSISAHAQRFKLLYLFFFYLYQQFIHVWFMFMN